MPDWAVAAGAAALLVLVGSISAAGARDALEDLGPTVGFAAALLVLADGCRRAGLFAYFGAAMAAGARGRPRRLLGLVFLVAAGTTAVLSLDATIVLLTPVVFSTAARLRFSPRPHVYACTHLANSASLLLPVSNLTNLLAFDASGLSFARFAALMAAAVAGGDRDRVGGAVARVPERARACRGIRRTAEPPTDPPVFALAVLGLTLVGFMVVEPVWAAVAGALVLAVRERPSPRELAGAAEPGFLVFVLGLGVVVAAASDHGLRDAVDSLIPHGAGLPALIAIAVLAAVVANLVNNLPATLIMLPAVAAGGRRPGAGHARRRQRRPEPVLRRLAGHAAVAARHARARRADRHPRVHACSGCSTVPAILLAATAGLWLALQVV